MHSNTPISGHRGIDRLFFAIVPDDDARARIASWAQAFRHAQAMTGKAIDPGRYHITVHLLGDFAGVPEQLIASAWGVADRFRSSGGVDVMLDRARSFARPGSRRGSPFVLSCSEANTPIHALQRHWVDQMRVAGVPVVTDHAFTPHLTLAYDRKVVAEQPIPPVRWVAREIVLMHSLVGQGRYERLRQIELA